MIRVGIAGIGFMGLVHFETYKSLPGVRVAAIASRSPARRAGDWRGIQGNFGPKGDVVDLSGVRAYSTVEELCADPAIDLVDLTLPPAAHTSAALAAFAAGKHVFVEKPLAMTPRDCERMVAAAQKADRLLLVGHVLPYFPEYAWLLKEVRSGRHGRLLGGSFQRVVADPLWVPDYWKRDVVGGPMLDLHVHDAHFIRQLFGMPVRVTARGSQRAGLPESWHALLEFEDPGVAVHATSGVAPQGRPFLHGFEVRTERSVFTFSFAVLGTDGRYLCPPTILDDRGRARTVDLGCGDPMLAFGAELRDVLRAVAGKPHSDALGAELARDAILLCQRQSESLAKGRTVKV